MIFFILIGLYSALQVYLFRRLRGYLQRKIPDPRRARTAGRAALLFFLLMSLPLFWIALLGLLPHQPYPRPIRAQMVVFAIWAVGSVGSGAALLACDLIRGALARMPRREEKRKGKRDEKIDLQRRQLLKAGVGAVAATPFILSGYGALRGRKAFEIEHFDLPLDGLSGALAGLTVVQLTDIHVGPFMPPEELAAYVEAINRLEPDFVALTGDFIASSRSEVEPCVETLARLKARRGIYACLGNHDAYAGIEDEITRRFAEKGVRMLRNEAASHRIGNTTLSLLGIDDLRWGAPDFPRALAAAAEAPGEVRLLLSHRPEIFPDAARSGVEIVLWPGSGESFHRPPAHSLCRGHVPSSPPSFEPRECEGLHALRRPRYRHHGPAHPYQLPAADRALNSKKSLVSSSELGPGTRNP